MAEATLKILAFVTNRLRRWGMNKAYTKLSDYLYGKIDINEKYGEVYEDCYRKLKASMPDIDLKWGWMQKEHIQFLFSGLTESELRPETVLLKDTYEELLPKKHPVAMATMEAFKADKRDDRIALMLKEVLSKLQLPHCEVAVMFGNSLQNIELTPKYRVVHYVKKPSEEELKKAEAERLAAEQAQKIKALVGGSLVDMVNIMSRQRERMAQITSIKAVHGHRYLSYCPVSFTIGNCGECTLDEGDIYFHFPDFVEIRRNNEERTLFPDILNPNTPIHIYSDEHKVRFDLGNINMARGKSSPNIFVRIPHDVQEVKVHWSFSSRQMVDEGWLTIDNKPELVYDTKSVVNVPEENPRVEEYVEDITD